jgi:hypothetical protein
MMRAHLYMPTIRLRAPGFGTFGEPRPAFWMTATEADVEEHLRPLMHETCVERYDEWRDHWARIEDETLDGRWSFLVPARPSKEDPPMLMIRVFPYSGLNNEKDTYLRIPGETEYEGDPKGFAAWLRGVDVRHLSELVDMLGLFRLAEG